MPELPSRPDLDQLRRQARELSRAAAAGDPDALTRLRAVSDRTMLSAAQLALAREYGFPSWPALKSEVERRRPRGRREFTERRSFGSAGPIETMDGMLTPGLLVIGPDRAVLDGVLVLRPDRVLPHETWPSLDDVLVTDDRGLTYGLRITGMGGSGDHPDVMQVSIQVEPRPEPGAAWVELRRPDGSATRLVGSPRAAVRVGRVVPTPVSAAENELDRLARFLIELKLHGSADDHLARQCSFVRGRLAEIRDAGQLDPGSESPDRLARLCAVVTGEEKADLPAGWAGTLDAADRTDGPRCHLDLGVSIPELDGVVTRLDSLDSGPDQWRLYLRALPEWFAYAEDGSRKWTPVTVRAEDDRGGRYVDSYGGGGGPEAGLLFHPRLDPLARTLTLTLRGGGQDVVVTISLPAGVESGGG